MFHVSVDTDRCQGHARCLAFAPEVFDFDDEGYAFVPDGEADRDDLGEDVKLAVANCPERAIVISKVSRSGA